ncbi:VanZ family protein [Fictibacillus iocasae]|uniref:VanZ family protein n=1 Tax=Fictibacillus iocasae TaxID=2715437 RepID=A0ABW2NLB3_9BACL
MAKKIGSWLLVALWASVIFYASSQPYEKQDMKPVWEENLPTEWIDENAAFIEVPYAGEWVSVAEDGAAAVIEFFVRKAAHLGTYFILAVLLYNATRNPAVSWVLAVLYAMSDEYHQSLTPNRSPHWEDVVIDAVGALLGVLLCTMIIKRRKKRR